MEAALCFAMDNICCIYSPVFHTDTS
jgi:hypothetical protein